MTGLREGPYNICVMTSDIPLSTYMFPTDGTKPQNNDDNSKHIVGITLKKKKKNPLTFLFKIKTTDVVA